jgi:hypothetical protein
VRDGDPAALAGLCDRRGPAVLAYVHHVAGDAAAVLAAAEAFAHFRAAVHAAQDTSEINPEALLVNATRQAAARHATIVAPGHCAAVPSLLAARADRTITLAELDRLEEHLESCWTCRAPVARFQAAERAYRNPPATPVAPEVAAVIVAAMTAAAPVRADEPPPPPPEPVAPPLTAAGLNGGSQIEPVDEPAPGLDQPTTAFRTLDAIEAAPVPVPAPEPEPVAPAPAKRRALPRRGKDDAPAAAAGKPRAQRAAPAIARPARRTRPAGSAPSGLRPGVVLPIALVALALVTALFVSGVFGADAPTPSSSNSPQPVAAPPAPRTTPEVVEVPGVDDSSAAAVERAKARARRAEQGTKATTTPATPPPPPAAAAPAPAPASTPPAGSTAAEPKRKSNTSSSTGIDANNGATGAEQLPPAADTSTVPELAPPPEAAVPTPPG